MITYKISTIENFEENHSDYFNSLLNLIEKWNCLSKNIDEIIITDEIDEEIERYCTNNPRKPELIRTREYRAIAKIIDFDDKKKIFFDALYVNQSVSFAHQIFLNQLIEVYADDIVASKYSVPQTFHANTPLTEIIKIFFSQWATINYSNTIEKDIGYEQEKIHSDVKMYVDEFKRNIRKLHYQHQKDLNLQRFWLDAIGGVDDFIRRCLDVKFDNGSFSNLQEFDAIIPPLLLEIGNQTQGLLSSDNIEISNIRKYIIEILKICYIEIPSENPMNVQVMETPKRLFKSSIVDTEPRIVAFIDILGFSSIINEYDSEKTSNILKELHDTLEMAVNISIENMMNPKAQTDMKEYLEYRMFSDCICISLPYIEFGKDFHIQFISLATIVKSYQLAMMQKGFFVRGGISIGSFYSDKNMIFSGGLVSAYKLEQKIEYPVIAIDKTIIKRLSNSFTENSEGLFYENLLIYSKKEPEKIFLNPFDLLDNSIKHLDYLQSTMDDLITENEEESEDDLSGLLSSVLKLTNSFTKPIFNDAKDQMTQGNINKAKEEVLKLVNEQITKQNLRLTEISTSQNKPDKKENDEINKIISKYKFLENLLKWSLGQEDSNSFNYFDFTNN